MPEHPEIRHLTEQIASALTGAQVARAIVRQSKCLNRPEDEWRNLVEGRAILSARAKGKWCEMQLSGDVFLRLNLGMGGEFWLRQPGEEADPKYRILLNLADGRSISVTFWWFGSLHAVRAGEAHPPFDSLGVDALAPELTEEAFYRLFSSRKGAIKPLLLRQDILCGLGNYYAQDLFFDARVHPMRRACDLTREEFDALYRAMRTTFAESARLGGADYECDLYREKGRYSRRAIAYREGEPCPVCGIPIEKLATGATASYICPHCQKIS